MRTYDSRPKAIAANNSHQPVLAALAAAIIIFMLPGLTAAASTANAVDSLVSLAATLAQDKVLKGSDGTVAVRISLATARLPNDLQRAPQPVDLVVVLDRSGSMQGAKIDDARQAVLQLIERLGPADRLALVVYSNSAETLHSLAPMDRHHRRRLAASVNRIYADGGTNLGGGLDLGLSILHRTPGRERQRKVILISDGLANQGITDPTALATMASSAAEHGWSVTTIGVGHDFNELLMTSIADHGAGRYYFLEEPGVMAHVFEQEFLNTRRVAASGLEIRLQVGPGVQLLHAGGYPIRHQEGWTLVNPGDLFSGVERNLFLTFQVPTETERTIPLGGLEVHYRHDNAARVLRSPQTLKLTCVSDPRAVLSGIDKQTWSDQVVQEEYNRLRENVADALRKGEKEEALKQIQEYDARNQAINAAVGSAAVADNLQRALPALKSSVEETFSGPAPAVGASVLPMGFRRESFSCAHTAPVSDSASTPMVRNLYRVNGFPIYPTRT